MHPQRSKVMSMTASRRIPLTGMLMLGMASLVWADQVTEVGADFLEYLGSLEDADDNWTDFTAEAIATRQATAPAGAQNTTEAAKSAAPARVSQAAASSKSSSHEMSKAEQ
jgi:hypothetical protein